MQIDVSLLSAKSRDRYLRIGRTVGSVDTLKQANKTLQALAEHAAPLAEAGFGAEDAVTLAAARDTLIAAGSGRETRAGKKKTVIRDYDAAFQMAKSARLGARTILLSAQRLLEEQGEEETVRVIDATLSATRSVPDEGEKLALQMESLRSTCLISAIADLTDKRGGPAIVKRLQSCTDELREAMKEKPLAGTQVSTEQMDIIDGLIVTLCRQARNAARQAARDLSKPALVKAFALEFIDAKNSRAEEEEAPHAPTGP